jgi:hypothetical protein
MRLLTLLVLKPAMTLTTSAMHEVGTVTCGTDTVGRLTVEMQGTVAQRATRVAQRTAHATKVRCLQLTFVTNTGRTELRRTSMPSSMIAVSRWTLRSATVAPETGRRSKCL